MVNFRWIILYISVGRVEVVDFNITRFVGSGRKWTAGEGSLQRWSRTANRSGHEWLS
jgi:hypothetical protein